MLQRFRKFGLALAGLAMTASAAVAQNFDLDELVQVDVLPGWRMPNGNHMAAVRVQLAPGWHTYWRQPGDTGIPPQFNWSGSTNLQAAKVHWPIPEIIDLGGSSSLGYHDQVIWPVELTPASPGAISLRAELQIGVCEEVCLPAEFAVQVTLPAGGQADSRIGASLQAQPVAGQGRAGCQVAPIADGLGVTMRFPRGAARDVQRIVLEAGDPRIWVSRPSHELQGDFWISQSEMVPPNGKPFALARDDLRMTVFARNGVFEYWGCTGF